MRDAAAAVRATAAAAVPAALTCCQQVLHALDGQEPVGVLRLPDAVKEYGQVVVVIKLVQVHLEGYRTGCNWHGLQQTVGGVVSVHAATLCKHISSMHLNPTADVDSNQYCCTQPHNIWSAAC